MSKTLLLTGVSGFIGQNLVPALVADGWFVHGIVRPTSQVGHPAFEQALKTGQLQNHTWDGSTQSLGKIVSKVSPQAILHLATRFIVQHQPSDLEDLIRSNILFGNQLCECAAQAKVPAFLNVGTFWQNYLQDAYHPLNLYAATKQAFEDILRFYVETTSTRFLTLRLVDSYGPADTRKKLIFFLKNAVETGSMLKMSPGEQKIDLVFISDVLNAFKIALDRLVHFKENKSKTHEIFSVSSGNPRSLKEVVSAFEKVRGVKVPVEWGALPYRNREIFNPAPYYPVLPGWRPQVSLEEGFSQI